MGSRVWNMKTVLKTRLESLEQKLHDQQEIIDKKFEHEKLTIKAFEEKEAEDRAEILKVTSERKQMSVKVNLFAAERQQLELEVTKLMKEVTKLKKDRQK